jgi:hypothetical protein
MNRCVGFVFSRVLPPLFPFFELRNFACVICVSQNTEYKVVLHRLCDLCLYFPVLRKKENKTKKKHR